MELRNTLKALVEELYHVHSGSFSWSEEHSFPNFSTAKNDGQVSFPHKALKLLRQLSEVLYENRLPEESNIEFENYEKLVRQTITDLYAAGEFHGHGMDKGKDEVVLAKLKSLISEALAKGIREYTHYFSAWTIGIEKPAPFKLGPVTFLSRVDWIDSVNFSPRAVEEFLNVPEANRIWKEKLKDALQLPRGEHPALEGLAGFVYTAISECPAVLKVTIHSYEKDLSHKFAQLICKTALDAVSLGFGTSEFFYQQTLYEERLPPVSSSSLMESEGFLYVPGYSLSKRIPHLTEEEVTQHLVKIEPILSAFSSIIEALVNPANHKHPKLANRWATALDWFGEGNRELSDAIALTKLATCLDVLACAGMGKGIAEMVSHLTGISQDTEVTSGRKASKLGTVIKKDIYGAGRSQILHGNNVDRLKPFARERQQATKLARHVLIESAVRLQYYQGDDDDNEAFRAIPAPQNQKEE